MKRGDMVSVSGGKYRFDAKVLVASETMTILEEAPGFTVILHRNMGEMHPSWSINKTSVEVTVLSPKLLSDFHQRLYALEKKTRQ